MKWVCSVCGYVYEGEKAPEQCPVCKAPASKFIKQEAEMAWAAEHVVGVAKGAPEEIIRGLRENFQGECTEVGMYSAMARGAPRGLSGNPACGEKAAFEEAEHAAQVRWRDAGRSGDGQHERRTCKCWEMRMPRWQDRAGGRQTLNLDAIHDTVHEMATKPSRHGKAFAGLLLRGIRKIRGRSGCALVFDTGKGMLAWGIPLIAP